MTDTTQNSPESENPNEAQPACEAVREAVESGHDVAERVRQIVVDLFQGRQGVTTTAREAIHGIVETATDIAKRSAPSNPDSVVKDVVDGIGKGLKTVAQTTQDVVKEAAERGQRFASEDVDKAKQNLTSIREILMDTVKYFSDRVSTETGSTFKEMKTHAENAVAAATPVVTSSLEALAKHPIQTAGEAAGTAMRGGQLTAGALLSAVSGALAGAAELLDPNRRKKNNSDDPAEPQQ